MTDGQLVDRNFRWWSISEIACGAVLSYRNEKGRLQAVPIAGEGFEPRPLGYKPS